MDEILVANFMVFQEVVEDGGYDLVVGDEAWDVDHFWHENPELKRGSHVWLTDFVGFIPMPDGGDHEAYLTADYNAEMIEHIARFPRIRDRAIFVGNPGDVIPETFGPDLPKIPDWTEEHFDFSGYITGFTPPTQDEVEEWRADLGYRPDEKVCIVTVGGSGVGRDLLEKVLAAFPMARETGSRAAHDRRRRPKHRPGEPAPTGRGRGARLRGPSLPEPVGLRPRRGPGRVDHDHGADRRQAAVPLLPARATTSSRTTTSATASTSTGRAGTWTTPPPTPMHSPRPSPPRSGRRSATGDVETDGARRAAEMIAELI